jgi:hypothetical protein
LPYLQNRYGTADSFFEVIHNPFACQLKTGL